MAKYSSMAVMVPSAFSPRVSVISNAWREVVRNDSSPVARNFTGRRTLRETGGDKLAAARLLGIGKTTLYRKLKQYQIKQNVQ